MQKIWNGLILILLITAVTIYLFLSSGKFNKPAEDYKIGDSVSCKTEVSARKYMVKGWSLREKEYTWTDGPEASMLFDVKNAENKDLKLRMRAAAYLGGGLSYQTVSVYANDTKIADWKVSGEEYWYEAAITSKVAGRVSLKIKFVISDPTSPKEAGRSEDERKLGIAVRELVIDEQK